MEKYSILSSPLTIQSVYKILTEKQQLELSADAIEKIKKCRSYLDKKIENQKEPIYGVTTGFGSLCNTSVSEKDLGKLQENLMMSHACGMGDKVPEEIVRLMLLFVVRLFAYS